MAAALRLRAAALLGDELVLPVRVNDLLAVREPLGLKQRRLIATILRVHHPIADIDTGRRTNRIKLLPAGRPPR